MRDGKGPQEEEVVEEEGREDGLKMKRSAEVSRKVVVESTKSQGRRQRGRTQLREVNQIFDLKAICKT